MVKSYSREWKQFTHTIFEQNTTADAPVVEESFLTLQWVFNLAYSKNKLYFPGSSLRYRSFMFDLGTSPILTPLDSISRKRAFPFTGICMRVFFNSWFVGIPSSVNAWLPFILRLIFFQNFSGSSTSFSMKNVLMLLILGLVVREYKSLKEWTKFCMSFLQSFFRQNTFQLFRPSFQF